MAAVIRGKAHPCTPVGYGVVDKVALSVDVVAGDLLKATGAMASGQPVMALAPTGTTEADGIALMNGYAGQVGFSMGVHGEIDGFSALVPGTLLYPSGAVAGGIDTTAAGVAHMKAVTPSRIRYLFI